MAILGKTSITELDLITPLSVDNIATGTSSTTVARGDHSHGAGAFTDSATTKGGHYNPGFTGTTLTKNTSGENYYLTGVTLTLDGKGHVTALSGGESVDDNSDTKVTSVLNHYSPTSSTTKSAAAGTATDITNGSGVAVVSGIKMDAAGHVVDVVSTTLKSTNTNTDTNTAHSHSAGVGLTGSGNAGTSGTYTYKAKLRSETAFTVDSTGATTGATSKIYPVAVDKSGYLSVYVPWTDTDTNTWRPVYNGVDSTDTSSAATANAVKTAYDKAVSAYNLASGKTSNAGTVTSVKVTGGTGLSSGGTVTSSGTITLNHAVAYSGTSLSKSTSGANYYLTGVTLTLDGLGHVTALSGGESSDDNTNTHYTTRLYAGASGTAAHSAVTNPYLKVTDDNTYRNQVRFVGGGATTITSDSAGTITITSTDTNTNTDTKVTSVGNHYSPTSSTTKSAAAGTATDITNGSGVAVISGIKMDAAGHVVDVVSTTLKSTNTNTDTNTAHSHSAGVGLTGSGNAGTSGTYTYKAKLRSETAFTVDSTGATTGATSKIYPVAVDKSGYLSVYVPWTDTNTDTNTWRPVYNGVDSTDTSSAATANAVKTAYDKAVDAYNLASGKTSNAGTVTSVKVTGGTGLSSGGTVTSSGTITLKHAVAYSGTSLSKSTSGANYYLTGVTLTLDGLGHVTALSGGESYDDNTNTNYYLTGVTGSGNGSVTFGVNGYGNVTWDASHTHSYAATSHKHSAANITGGTSGYFLKADANGNGVWQSVTIPSSYTLPTATATQLGGIKVGSFLSISSSSLSVSTGTSSSTVARGDHSHSNYALSGHTHSNYALSAHTHSIYALSGHTHDSYMARNEGMKALVLSASYTSTDATTASSTTNKVYLNCVKRNLANTTDTVNGYTQIQGVGSVTVYSDTAGVLKISGSSSSYTLPNATESVLGGVKVGNFLAASGGLLSVTTGTSSTTVARGDHSHSGYSPTGHTHPEYASSGHTHSGYLTSQTDYQVKSQTGTSKTFLLGTTASATTTGTTYKNLFVYMSGSSTNTTFYAPKISATTITASTAFYQSDERLKDFCGEIDVDFEKLKEIPKKYYTWKSDENKELQIGTSAQKVLEVYPELVGGSEDTNYAVDYARLSIVALKAIDKLHDENQMLRDLVEKMDKRITDLEEKLK